MGLEFVRAGENSPKNVQPDKDNGLPVCPNYKQIETCAIFAEIDPPSLASLDNFCGHEIKHEDTIGPLLGFRGKVYIPRAACTQIRDTLVEMMHEVNENVEPTDNLSEKNESEKNPAKLHELLEKEVKNIQKHNRKEEILKLWRESVYEIRCVPPETKDPTGHHFGPTSKDELTDEIVIETVGKFLKSLQDNIAGEGSDLRKGIIVIRMSAEHCPVAPKREEVGIRS